VLNYRRSDTALPLRAGLPDLAARIRQNLPPDAHAGSEIIHTPEVLYMTPDYSLLCEQLCALAESSRDPIPVLANASALLYEAMENVNWVGFYLVRGGALLLGPCHGKAACVRIEKGRGFCGTAYAQDAVQLVPDVHAFPGHIACDSASNSELVLPLHDAAGAVYGVLDLDSPLFNRFTEVDCLGLSQFAWTIEAILHEDVHSS
jgi:GAF domain-containing protein